MGRYLLGEGEACEVWGEVEVSLGLLARPMAVAAQARPVHAVLGGTDILGPHVGAQFVIVRVVVVVVVVGVGVGVGGGVGGEGAGGGRVGARHVLRLERADVVLQPALQRGGGSKGVEKMGQQGS